MSDNGDQAGQERRLTDENLRNERDNADRAVARQRRAVEGAADRVVQRARDNADAVLVTAREQADQKLAQESPSSGANEQTEAVGDERVLEDQTLQDERTSADDDLRGEREQTARALARLLPFEREQTDRSLLTERARSDADLSQRDNFLGIVSHDLRNLLSGMVMSAELLSIRAPAGEDGERVVAEAARIQRYAARMNRLIGDLVDIASIDADRLFVACTPGDPAALLAEAVDLFQHVASAKDITLVIEASPALGLANFDHDRMIQVLANLITNAIKFTGTGGAVRLRCERVDGQLRVCVSDTGVGISDTVLETVFERFWVGENDQRGLGLGLYISKHIIEAHRGTIGATSTIGEGSEFWFTLPA